MQINFIRRFKKYFGVSVFAIAVIGISIFASRHEYGDFKTFYSAAEAYHQGLNPYDTNNLSLSFGEKIHLPYVYPPLALFFFKPLTVVPYQTSSAIYMVFKLLALLFTILILRKIFDIEAYPTTFYFLFFFAFGSALMVDLRNGNISIFEQLAIWIGFYYYLRENYLAFTAAIVVASLLKLTPIFLLSLLLVEFDRKKTSYFIGGVLTLFIVFGSNAIFLPDLFSSFLHNSSGLFSTSLLGERGALNPATFPMVQDFFAIIGKDFFIPDYTAIIVYLLIVATAIVISMKAVRKLKLSGYKMATLFIICIVCFLYAIIVPRFKNYSYLLLIAPAFYIIFHTFSQKTFIALSLFFLVFLTYRNYGLFSQEILHFQNEYYSLIVAWFLWGICCYSVLSSNFKAPARSGS